MPVGSVVVDFGLTGSAYAEAVVAGQGTILATSLAEAFFMADVQPGADGHTDDEHVVAATLAKPTCTVPTAGVGFTIQLPSEMALFGKFILRWVWSSP